MLTETSIKAAKPKEKRYTLFDTGGLYIEIAPNGGKWWRFRYKDNGKTKVLSLGTYPDISLKNARVKRDEMRTQVSKGETPQPETNKKLLSPLFNDIADEWLAFKTKTWAARTRTSRMSFIRRLKEYMQDKCIADLGVRDFLRLFRQFEAQKQYVSTRIMSGICSQIMRYAVLSEYIESNPISEISALLVNAKTGHYATLLEPDAILVIVLLDGIYMSPLNATWPALDPVMPLTKSSRFDT